jgi:hypothetical protein
MGDLWTSVQPSERSSPESHRRRSLSSSPPTRARRKLDLQERSRRLDSDFESMPVVGVGDSAYPNIYHSTTSEERKRKCRERRKKRTERKNNSQLIPTEKASLIPANGKHVTKEEEHLTPNRRIYRCHSDDNVKLLAEMIRQEREQNV